MPETKKVVARVIIEIVGKPEKHVKNALGLVIDQIKVEEGFKVTEEKTFDPKKTENYFSTFSEMVIEFEKPAMIIGFCFDYMPSSLEIIEPEYLDLRSAELAGLLNDLLTRLHSMSMSMANTSAENQILKQNTEALLKNFVMHALKEPKTMEELSKVAGIKPKQLKPFIEKYVKQGKIKKSKNSYTLIKDLY